MQKFITRTLLASVLLFGLAALAVAPVTSQPPVPPVGAVFVSTNHNNTHPTAPPGEPANQVVMYSRANDGTLSFIDRFDTGGQGSGPSIRFAGDGLGSAHSVELSQDHRWLFVTNAASNDVSVFRVSKKGLELIDLVPSGGVFPNSITQHGKLVYVLNSAGDGNITGFLLSNQGTLTPIPGSTRVLNANQDPVRPDTLFNPTQVSFTPDGRQLVVTIKDGPAAGALPGVIPTGPGRVLVFGVGRDGLPTQNFTQTNLDNLGPFGFSFDRHGNLLVALFVGGPNLTGAAGSFQINADGSLTPITPNVPNGQLDTCWLENNGRYAYGANYTSGTISSYSIGNDGSLTLLEAEAGDTDPPDPPKTQGSTPLDLRLSHDGRYLYNVLPGSGKVAAWQINHDGSLTKIGEFPGLPDTVNGDVAQCELSPGVFTPCEFGPGGSPAGIAVF
jgi:6-phosphogluconolactonase